MKLSRFPVLVIILLGGLSMVLGTAGSATAQTSAGEDQARQQLIERAQAAHGKGDHRAALDFAQRASRLRKSPTLLLFIAEEQSELTLFADAYASAQQCLREAELDRTARLREQSIERCRSMADQLKAKVSYVVINVPTAPEGLSVRLSGQQLNQAAIGIPFLITPGNVTVEATAPSHVPYRLDITVPEGKTINVTVNLARQPVEVACPAGQRADAGGRCVGDTCRVGMMPTPDGVGCCWPGQDWDATSHGCSGIPRCPPGLAPLDGGCVEVPNTLGAAGGGFAERRPTPRGERAVPYGLVVGGAGLAIAAAGGITWAIANSRFNELQSACDTSCTVTDRRARIERIKTLDNWALGMSLVGGALVAAGAVVHLWWLPRLRNTDVAFDPSTGSIHLLGRF